MITLACLCWAIDNNLARKVSASDALFIAGSKGLIAGAVNCVLALSLGAKMPNAEIVVATMSIRLLGYGISLVMFVLALRGLGGRAYRCLLLHRSVHWRSGSAGLARRID